MTRMNMAYAQLPIRDVKNSNGDDRDREGGTIVTVSTLGPDLPPESCIDEQENEEEDMYGPELPPGFNQERDKGRKRVLGPCLPPAGVSLQSTSQLILYIININTEIHTGTLQKYIRLYYTYKHT